MQRVFRVVDTRELRPVGLKTTSGLDNSIRANGIISPILLAEVPDEDGVIQLVIVDGNRRVRAAQAAGLTKVPAVVLKETTQADRSRLTLICNHLRSLNFYTESLAVTALGEDARGVELAAKAMGLSASKILGMVRRLEQMPPEVRTAMYEERMPVSAATDIAAFPRSLQDEVVSHLQERGWLDTRTLAGMKAGWERRHGPINPRASKRRAAPPAIDTWSDPGSDEDIPVPAGPSSWAVQEVAPGRPIAPPEAGTTRPAGPAPASVVQTLPVTPTQPVDPEQDAAASPPADTLENIPEPGLASHREIVTVERPSVDASSGHPVAGGSVIASPPAPPAVDPFLARLDAELVRLARETVARDLPRSAWIDRAMRAWSLADSAAHHQAAVTP